MTEIIERVLGGGGGNGVGGIFGEAREAMIGGCWGIFMSAGFFFVFFFTGMIMLFGVIDLPVIVLNNRAIMFPFVCVLGISALMSPFMGALFGAQSGVYSVVRHVGCFILYIGFLIGGMAAAAMFL